MNCAECKEEIKVNLQDLVDAAHDMLFTWDYYRDPRDFSPWYRIRYGDRFLMLPGPIERPI